MSSEENPRPLVAELPDEEPSSAQRYLASLAANGLLDDPLVRHLMASPIDDEPYTDEERAEDAEGWQEYLRGEGRDWNDFQAELERGA